MTIMIKDVLKRPLFEDVKILAGKNGLNRKVEWVHILEISRFGHLLNGNEIILTTGLGWAHDEKKSLSFLQQLLDYKVSALFIELFTDQKTLPKKMLEIAEKNDFPIIIFKKEVRFVDITKDLHELLLAYNENLWWKLESFYKKLNKTLLDNGNIRDFLRILHKESQKQIGLKYNGNYHFFPAPSNKKQKQWIIDLESDGQKKYYHTTFELFGNKISSLYFLEEKSNLNQFDKMALKRCNDIISQFFWKYNQKKESLEIIKNEWIFEAIIGDLSHNEIVENIQQNISGTIMKEIVIAVNPIKEVFSLNDNNQNLELVYIMYLRPILLKYELKLLTVKDKKRANYIFLLLNQGSNNINRQLEKALDYIYNHNIHPSIQKELKWISFGRTITNYEKINESYNTAISTLNYQKKFGVLKQPFYNSLGMYRIVEQIKNNDILKELILDYIGPLLKNDRDENTELVKTLQIYFKNSEAKQKTAEELYIVRQTLYHRLNQIESLIGDNYTNSKKRFMVEFSVYALKYTEI